MNLRKHGMFLAVMLVLISVTVAGCNRSLSSAPVATPTVIIPTSQFGTAIATGANSMGGIEVMGTLTAAAKTATALGGTPASPAVGGGTINTLTPTPTLGTVVPTNTPTTTPPVLGTTNTPTVAAIAIPSNTPGRPSTYTVQQGDHVYCLGRRFDVDPAQILSLNGLIDGQVLMPGTSLRMPTTGSFPGTRALRPHPATYTVTSANETFNYVACLYGDVDPEDIALVNGLPLSSALRAGQVLKIP